MPPKPGKDPGGKAPALTQIKTSASYAMTPKPLQTLPPQSPSPSDWYNQTLIEQTQQLSQTYAQTTATLHQQQQHVVASRPSTSSSVVAPRPTSSTTVVATNPTIKSKYFHKPQCEQTIVLLENQTWNEDPFQIPPRVFAPKTHFLQSSPLHTQQFYEAILVDTGSISVKITLTPDQTEIAFSTILIHKILTQEQWGPHPLQPRRFSIAHNPPSFNYYDYQQAWFNTFFYQNSRLSHSWMFTFKDDFPRTFPNWFFSWWTHFGSLPQIFPPSIHEAFLLFQTKFQPTQALSKFPCILHFMVQFCIPWICAWNYTILSQNPFSYLARSFQIKWWDNWHKVQLVTPQAVHKFFQQHPVIAMSSDPQFLLQRSQIIPQLAATKSKKELRQQLMDTLSSLSDSDDEEASPSNPNHDSQDSVEDLAQDNEDDCYGIFTPVQTRSKSRQADPKRRPL